MSTPAIVPAPPPLSDPKPSVDRIDELARRILTGDILLPKFQRDFVWKPQRILALLDSIARGYPIGSILLWLTRQELKSERRIADLDVAGKEPEYPYNYVLDGQQRLSTICGALFWNGAKASSQWNIAYDLRAEKFVHPNTLDDLALHQIRVNRLSNPSEFFAHVARLDSLTTPDKEELKGRAKRLFDRFKDYKIAVVTLGDMSIKDVAPIFERINSQGVPLTRVDLLRAATWSKDFDLMESIDQIRQALEEKGFRDMDAKAILRNISAAQGGGFTIGDSEHLRGNTPQQNLEAVQLTEESYRLAVDFLDLELGLVSSFALPYTNQVTILAEVFRLLPLSPKPGQYEALKRWFWQTSFSGYFSGWNSGQMESDLRNIRAFAAGQIESLPVSAVRPDRGTWFERAFRSGSALSKAYTLLLAGRRPRDLLTGGNIDTRPSLSWSNQKEFHHFFPKKWLKQAGVDSAHTNAIANMVFLTSASNKIISGGRPSVYVNDAKAKLGGEFMTVLASNLISPEALDCALRDDYEGFLAARAKSIDAVATELAGWPSTTPSGHLGLDEGDSDDELDAAISTEA